MTKIHAIKTVVSTTTLIVALGISQSGCGQAQSPIWHQIEQVILTDLENGSALTVIEAAVDALDPALANDAAATDAVIQAAINYLVSIGVLPTPAAKANATARLADISAKVAKTAPAK